MSSETKIENPQPGIYKVTKGQYIDAAIFLIDVSQPDESEFTYLTIYNPDSQESHEVPLQEWQIIASEDGLVWTASIPDDIKDEYVQGPISSLDEL